MSLCADWRSLDSITAIGTDIVELTGNHNNNYGTEANINSIKKYQELGMKTFGGGINEEEAAKPLILKEKTKTSQFSVITSQPHLKQMANSLTAINLAQMAIPKQALKPTSKKLKLVAISLLLIFNSQNATAIQTDTPKCQPAINQSLVNNHSSVNLSIGVRISSSGPKPTIHKPSNITTANQFTMASATSSLTKHIGQALNVATS